MMAHALLSMAVILVQDHLSLSDAFRDSGIAGYAVMAMTVFGVLFSLRSAFDIRMQRLAPKKLQKRLEASIHSGDVATAQRDASISETHLGRVIASGLAGHTAGLDEMLSSSARASSIESLRLGNRLANVSRLGGMVLLATGLGTANALAVTFFKMARLENLTDVDLHWNLALAFSYGMLGILAAAICYGSFFVMDHQLTKRLLRVREMADDMLHFAGTRNRPQATDPSP